MKCQASATQEARPINEIGEAPSSAPPSHSPVQTVLPKVSLILVHPKHLHHLIAQVIDNLHRDASAGRRGKGARSIAVEAIPCLKVDVGFERGFKRFVGVVGTQKIGVADEKTFLVIVGVDKPAGDVVGVVADHFAG
ncbi:MAG: hypothetical protein ORN21_06280, partial [Methylophilaceae bacterium]|nr:hypothetical protein [Methylophilaceae bacterium]